MVLVAAQFAYRDGQQYLR